MEVCLEFHLGRQGFENQSTESAFD